MKAPVGDLAGRLGALLRQGALELAPIGAGRTPERWAELTTIARRDLSEGRLAEAHVDAVQILREDGRQPEPGCLYGVWASDHPARRVSADPGTGATLVLRGVKAFCTGAGLVDRALVTVFPTVEERNTTSGDCGLSAPLLVDIDVTRLGEGRIDRRGWTTGAMADTSTADVDLSDLTVPAHWVVGETGWYLDRPGFWDGAVGPAACWAGGALGLLDRVRARAPADAHALAHLGAMAARGWGLESALTAAGRGVDVPQDQASALTSRARALIVRHLVDDGCADIQERCARALGPRSLVADPGVHARDQALTLYRRQCHAERDLEALGRCVIEQDQADRLALHPEGSDPGPGTEHETFVDLFVEQVP